jgi:hypothetical protein
MSRRITVPHRRPRGPLRAAAPVALAALAGCGAASPDPGALAAPDAAALAPRVALTFGVHRVAVEPPFSARRVEPAGVLVRGTFEAPCHPYGAAADVARVADTLVLRVVGQPPAACWAAVQSVAYEARVADAPADRVILRVVHEGAAGRPERQSVFVLPLERR